MPVPPGGVGRHDAAGLAATLLLVAAPAGAQPAAPDRAWTLDLTTYGWLSATDGTVGAGDLRVGVSNSFVDTIEQSDSVLSFMARGELRRGRLGLFLDGQYSRLGYDDVRAGPLTADATSELSILEFGAAWELARGAPLLGGAPWALDVLGGGRWTHLRTDVTPRRLRGVESTSDWVDPFVGLRLRGALGERWTYSLRGDVGGFGAGTEFAWQAIATVGYRFELLGLESTALLGYRALSQDYESARQVWDITLHGPVLGLKIRF